LQEANGGRNWHLTIFFLHASHQGMPKSRILTLSHDHELSSLRARILEDAGYSVTAPCGQAEALLALVKDEFDLVLLCHSMVERFVNEVLRMYREANPNGRVLGVLESRSDLPKFKVDQTVAGADGPDALLRAVESCLANKKVGAD
jgi:CheY-like chemotaxis protein